jgi:hypothetical protein
MALLYMSCALLSAVKGQGEGRLASALKKEAIQQINRRLCNSRTANTSETICSIGFLSTGIWVCTKSEMGHPDMRL